ncbi:MAG: PPC domain-containing protein [Kofleriaceae bacterium]
MAIRVAVLSCSLHGLSACSDELELTPLYNHANGRIVIEMNREIDGETLYVRARRGNFGQLDCAKLVTEIAPVEGASGSRIDGPTVDPALTKPFYGPEWASNPTPEMLAQLELGTDSIIDVCLMDGSEVVYKVERDLFAAWDAGRKKGFGGKADDPGSGEQRINSAQAYGERCVGELGEIPFFEKTGEGTYSTYNCLESTAIPVTVTSSTGQVETPQTGTVPQCDNPQYIYSLCEAGPRVASRTNEQGTRWVLLCRKSIGGYASDQYNDIAMIGHNPFTGKTCFFQNALYQKKDGGHVPHPADVEKSTNLWSGVHGGLGGGIQCIRCHDADPFVHTPWIDGAKDNAGRPIVPKMGVDPDMPLGANDAPYALVNRRGQGWTAPKQLVSAEANACLKCHRMGGSSGEWGTDGPSRDGFWLDRLEGTSTAWADLTTDTYNQSVHKFWMPPDTSFASDDQFQNSEFQRALDFIQKCSKAPTTAGCIYEAIPETLGNVGGGGNLRNPVNLPDDELANQATTLIGMNKNTAGNTCSDCHAPNETTLRDWQHLTDSAETDCLKVDSGDGQMIDKTEDLSVGQGDFKVLGPFDVAGGSFFEAFMTGTGDADLYVKRGQEASENVYDCRPYGTDSNETCDRDQYNAAGPAKFWVGVQGYGAASVKVRVSYKAPGSGTRPAKDIVNCFRLDPSRDDAPFVPQKLGIYSAAAHLGWFQDTFKAAYPAGEGSNTADTWAIEYGRFKNRVSMPKGNHPRFSQEQFDIVAEWFVRGLPRLTTYIAPDTGPTTCTPSISSEVSSHVSAMSTQGWAAKNRSAGLAMYGCGSSTDPRQCLTSLANVESKSYGQGWTKFGTLRVLRELSFNTYYWMRSSADGRFIGNGSTSGDGAVLSDLQTNKDMRAQAAYDPGFFPDNRGWIFQGTQIGAAFCTMGLLTSNPDRIDFSESACSSVSTVDLYQHLGAGLNNGDYFAVNSKFSSDNPDSRTVQDPEAGFGPEGDLTIIPMVYDGTRYVGKPPVTTLTPHEGDTVLSPSTRLVISRFGNEDRQLGYVLRRLNATPNGSSYNITTTEVARYCVQGAKPAISFDEKYFVTHHYVTPNDYADLGFSSASDPAFQAILAKGAANIIVVNLLTGARTRVTNMKAGQYAIFPHFRSDGWIYFLVRDHNTGKEYAMASDAILQLN